MNSATIEPPIAPSCAAGRGPGHGLSVEVVDSFREIAPLAQQWAQLRPLRPELTWPWLKTWWEVYSARPTRRPTRLLLLRVHDDGGRLLGIAPWYVDCSSLPARTVVFLGSGEVCGDELTLLSRPGSEAQVAGAVVRWLDNNHRPDARPACWNLIKLESVRSDDTALKHLIADLSARGAVVRHRPLCHAWKIDLPATWDAYLALLSKDHRKKVRRLERSYIDSGRLRVIRVNDETSLAAGFDLLVQLHSKRWHGEGLPGVFASPSYLEFHRQLSRRMLEQQQLRLWWIELDGQPVAVEYQFSADDTVFAYQSGYDPQAAAHQPGNLAMIVSIQSAIADGFRGIDLMRGDEPYKAHWRAQPVDLLETRIALHGWRHRWHCRAWARLSRLKSWLREQSWL